MTAAEKTDRPLELTDYEAIRPYDGRVLQSTLDELHALIPNVTAVRTDRFKGEPINEKNPMRLILEHGAHGKFRMGVPEDAANAPVGHIVKEMRVSADVARAALVACARLAALNPNGAWAVAPSHVPRLDVDRTQAGGKPLKPTDYLAETCDILAEELTQVGAIRFDYLTGDRGRRRAFMRFIGKTGSEEVAAIDAGGIALHARQQILKPDDESMLELNLWRMRRWADQLGTDPDTLAELFPILVFLTSSLHLTRIDLH